MDRIHPACFFVFKLGQTEKQKMPTILTHSFVPIALGRIITDKKLPLRFWLLAVFCSVLPDADVIGFSLGVRYGDFLGHRGFFHSVFFALILSAVVALLAFHKSPLFSKKWCLIWLFFFCVMPRMVSWTLSLMADWVSHYFRRLIPLAIFLHTGH